MSACGLCFSFCQRCLRFLPGVAAGLPACRPGSGFVVISFRVASFCVRSGCQVMAGPASGCCPICPEPVLSSPEHAPGACCQRWRPGGRGYEGQGSTVSPELDGTVPILPDINVLPLKTPVFFIIFKQIKLHIVL